MERFSFVFLVAGLVFFGLAFVVSAWFPMLPVQDLEVRTLEQMAQQQPLEFLELQEQYPEAYAAAFGGMSDAEAFAEALRVMMYGSRTAMTLPLAIHAAHGGDYSTFARLGLQTNRGLREMLAFGMLCCVTCVEDVARIEEEDVARETAGTFLGDGRVRRQLEVCERWPRGRIL